MTHRNGAHDLNRDRNAYRVVIGTRNPGRTRFRNSGQKGSVTGHVPGADHRPIVTERDRLERIQRTRRPINKPLAAMPASDRREEAEGPKNSPRARSPAVFAAVNSIRVKTSFLSLRDEGVLTPVDPARARPNAIGVYSLCLGVNTRNPHDDWDLLQAVLTASGVTGFRLRGALTASIAGLPLISGNAAVNAAEKHKKNATKAHAERKKTQRKTQPSHGLNGNNSYRRITVIIGR